MFVLSILSRELLEFFDLLLSTTVFGEHLKVPSGPVIAPSLGPEVLLRALRSPAVLLSQQQRPRPTSGCCTSRESKKYTGQYLLGVGERKGTWYLGRREGEKGKARQTSVADLRDSAPSRSGVSPPTPKAMPLPRRSVITQGWLPGSPGWLGGATLNAWPVLSGSSDG